MPEGYEEEVAERFIQPAFAENIDRVDIHVAIPRHQLAFKF
jgi:hypothetical protein